MIDDHHPAGNLRRISGTWYFYPGDGTRYTFSETAYSGRQPYITQVDSAGLTVSTSTVDSSGRFTKIETANSNLYFTLKYDSNGLSELHINDDDDAQIVDYDVSNNSGWKRLDKVKYAGSIDSIDSDTFVAYSYHSTTHNMETVSSKIDGSTTLTLATFTYDVNDRLTRTRSRTWSSSSTRSGGSP